MSAAAITTVAIVLVGIVGLAIYVVAEIRHHRWYKSPSEDPWKKHR